MTEGTGARKVRNKPGDPASAPQHPTNVQRRWLERGAGQPGGKLPLFDTRGREVPRATIRACLAAGWAEPWFANPAKPDWLVCKLTAEGYRIIGRSPPAAATRSG